MEHNSVIVYTSPFERDASEGLYWLLQTYPYQIVGFLLAFIVVALFGEMFMDYISKAKRWLKGSGPKRGL